MLYVNDRPEGKFICAEIVKLYGIVLFAEAFFLIASCIFGSEERYLLCPLILIIWVGRSCLFDVDGVGTS